MLTGLLTEITAASEMPPYQPTAKTDPVGTDLRAARRERHGRQNWTYHRDNGRLGDATLPTHRKNRSGRGGSPSRPPRTAWQAELGFSPG